jgi:hypothetical protein
MIIAIVVCAIIQIIFIGLLLTDSSLIGRQVGLFHGTFTLFTRVYLLSILLTFFITGVIFARKSMKLGDPEIKLRGKFLFLAFLFYTVSVILETLLPLTAFTAVLTRLIMIFSAFAFYFGFILPKSLKKTLLRK